MNKYYLMNLKVFHLKNVNSTNNFAIRKIKQGKIMGIVISDSQKKLTLTNFLRKKYGKNLSNLSGIHRPGIVHRLDNDTSGLLLIAKNNKIHKLLQEKFKKKEINRLYLTISWGLLKKNSGTLSMNIGRTT